MVIVISTLGPHWAVAWLRLAAERITAASDHLSALDRAIGDGDHGVNMARGFQALSPKLDERASIADTLKLAATTLMSTVGGAAGPLYGSAFLRAAGKAGKGLTSADLIELLDAARGGIVARGKAEVGEKTMVDAWAPAVEAARKHADVSPHELLVAVAAAAEDAAAATEPLKATKGRASYLGERSIGHRDPGAESTAILLRAAADAAAAAAGSN